MDLRQMRQFVAVAEELSFRRAAEKLHMSQPPLTTAIKNLEQELQVTLLDRTRHRVSLTAAGTALVSEAKRTLAQAHRAAEITRRTGAGMLGVLRLSYFPGATLKLLPDLLRPFRQSYPDVNLALSIAPSSRLSKSLVDGSVDIALVMPSVASGRGLSFQDYAKEHLVLAVPHLHPLSACQQVELRMLAKESFVGLAPNSDLAFESLVAAVCQQGGFVPHLEVAASDIMTVLALVGSGAGVALVPSSLRLIQSPAVAFVEVRRARKLLSYPIALAYDSSNDNPVVPAFLAVAGRLASS